MEFTNKLNQLRLYYLASNFNHVIKDAEKSKLSLQNTLERIVELELIERSNRSTQQRLRSSKIGRVKLMAEFDWAWPKEIDRSQIEGLLECDFIKDHQNLILAAPQGTGKTMIAKNIGLHAISRGHSVLFTTASQLVMDLAGQESTAALQRRLKRYVSPDLLIIDELGYLSFDNRSADLLFDIISKRYESGSIIITTNLAFKDWGSIFQGAACVTALIDRLTHHCKVLKISADSYRKMESLKIQKKKGSNK